MPKDFSEIDKIMGSYRQVFNSDAGKVVLDDMRKSWMNRSSFVPNDPYTTAFNEGQRSAVLRIQWMLEAKVKENENG